ncbi:putative D,D-dipeptide-binding periplasmic protein DdpA precursor [Streptomyces sp. YIM 121038]|uniref:ABC transporter substrate-binding protein n=1 Tax=Streptomyces sp. YIM 121038 TaxID=2136401 RepID=UPI001110F830|nr:ABC transporter substrate-binding protein [Streptomyces sp. YIM 121038]QCX75419.1 putative D,D-dipeptide-binding periplasmic protein DdpA precursor [Streptomyces sp. YIM 121038]
MNRKTLVLPALIGLLAPALAACGGSGSGDGDDPIAAGTTDRFRASKEVPAPFDPAYAYDAGSWNVLRQTLQTLMALPRGGGGEPEPEAAQKCGFTDTGNERYACTLRKDLKFADGKPLTAADVKFSIERVRDMKVTNPSGSAQLVSNVETIEVQGERGVVFHLKTPDATFPYKLATPTAGIVSPDHYRKGKLREGFDLDGSGPYTVKQEVKNDQLVKAVFTKNPNYKGSFSPQNKKVELRTFATSTAMGKALEDGDIDLMTRTMSPEQIKQLDVNPGKNLDLVDMPGLEIRYLAFNTDAASVKDKAVRQAMAQVIDRGALVGKVYGSTADPLYSLVPTTITGHSNSFFNRYNDPSVKKAKELLAGAGIDTPVKLTLHYTTDHYGPATKKEFEVLSQQLNDSGLFDVKIKGDVWNTFRAAAQQGKYDVYGMGWFPDFPDADNFLAPFLAEDNFLSSPYRNRTINNELIPTSRREADRLSAAKSIERIQDIVAEDVPVLPLWQGKQYIAARDDITGVEWALNSSSNLQLWELARGVGD